jgi:cell division protein FtsI/penicillin-binding protein 2
VTARSRERGSHAGRPRGNGLSLTGFGLPSLGTLTSGRLGGRPAAPPAPVPAAPVPADPAAPAAPPSSAAPTAPGVPLTPQPPAAPKLPRGPEALPVLEAPAPVEVPVAPAAPPPPATPPPPGAGLPLPPPSARGPRPAAPPRSPGSSRHRKQPGRRPFPVRKARLAAVLVVVIAVLGVGFTVGFGTEASAEPAAQSFLLDWQQGDWAQAAALTDGPPKDVAARLTSAYVDLDATNAFLAMDHIVQHGDTAVATFKAKVDLAQTGQQWSYTGQFGLTAQGGHWIVDWTPSVIYPGLGTGDRLAAVTTYAPRAEVEDMTGQPLLDTAADYRVGVYPGQLKNPAATAAAFSALTGLNEIQVLGQIQSAPPGSFLSLLTLDPDSFGTLWPRLAKVAGLTYQQHAERLFVSAAQDVVGVVGTENSGLLRDEGAAYQPGVTVGLSGIEQAYQDELVGTPTTSVVVVNAAGHVVAHPFTSKGGHAGVPVQTTLSSPAQSAATTALSGQPSSAEIVAVDTGTGAVRALASHTAGSLKLPSGGALDSKVEPGMAFSIVSAAALLSAGIGVNHALPCEPVANVGGETFTYQPSAAADATLASDFADGCGTAFANMSRTLTAQQLTSAERSFGIGATWQLRLPAFSGSAAAVSGAAAVAAQATGTGGVLVSPLGMATIAAEVADGTGRTPVLTTTDSSASRAPLSATELTGLRQLMRLAVTSGSAHAADLPGTPVYGQAGVVKSGTNSYLSWFVGYRGSLAVAVLETGSTATQAAAALAGHFLSAAG